MLSNIIGAFLFLVLQFLYVCVSYHQAAWGKGLYRGHGRPGHVFKLSLSLRKIKQPLSIGKKSKVRFFFFWSFALLEKTNLAGFVQDSCLFPLRTEEWIHEWMVATEFLFLKTTETVILNFKKGLCYFRTWWILKLGWWTKCLYLEIGGGRRFFDYIYFFLLNSFSSRWSSLDSKILLTHKTISKTALVHFRSVPDQVSSLWECPTVGANGSLKEEEGREWLLSTL